MDVSMLGKLHNSDKEEISEEEEEEETIYNTPRTKPVEFNYVPLCVISIVIVFFSFFALLVDNKFEIMEFETFNDYLAKRTQCYTNETNRLFRQSVPLICGKRPGDYCCTTQLTGIRFFFKPQCACVVILENGTKISIDQPVNVKPSGGWYFPVKSKLFNVNQLVRLPKMLHITSKTGLSISFEKKTDIHTVLRALQLLRAVPTLSDVFNP